MSGNPALAPSDAQSRSRRGGEKSQTFRKDHVEKQTQKVFTRKTKYKRGVVRFANAPTITPKSQI